MSSPYRRHVGASADRKKFGNKALRAFRAQGYTVIPINPHETASRGSAPTPACLDYPGPIDEATVYVPPAMGLRVVDEIARKGIKTVWLNPGADAEEVIARARALGLQPTVACSILGIGESPGRYYKGLCTFALAE